MGCCCTNQEKSAFGFERRTAARRSAKLALQIATWDRLKDADMETRLQSMINAQVGIASDGLEHENWAALHTNARAIAKRDALSAREDTRQQQRTIAKWEATTGLPRVERFMALSGLSDDAQAAIRPSLRCEPCPHADIMRFEPAITDVAKHASARSHGAQAADSSIRSALAEDWARRHFPIMEADCELPAAAEGGAAGKQSACMQNCICVCKGKGKGVKKLLSLIHDALKHQLPRGGESRKHLVEGVRCLPAASHCSRCDCSSRPWW